MDLPVNPTILPMLAKRVSELPRSGEWLFEPKWDGFRSLIFRDGDEVMLQSRDEKPLNRYFPELIDPILKQLPKRCVLDGEIVVAQNGALDFDALQLRIHPAASRVQMLSEQIPSSIVFFDLLAEGKQRFSQRAVCGTPTAVGGDAFRGEVAATYHARDERLFDRVRLVSSFRRCWSRRRCCQAGIRNLRVEQARDAQSETRA